MPSLHMPNISDRGSDLLSFCWLKPNVACDVPQEIMLGLNILASGKQNIIICMEFTKSAELD